MAYSTTKQLWELFIEAEANSYEKSAWCDLFLAQVISELHAGRPIQKVLNFGNFSGIGTLVGCEILSEVHQVVSLPGEGEELEPLRTHLLTKGWRGLTVLLALGQQNLACSSQLAHLLLFLYPLCLRQGKSTSETNNCFLHLEPPAVADFSLPKTPIKTKLGGSHGVLSPRVEFHRSISHSTNRSRRNLQSADGGSESNPSSDDVLQSCVLQPGGGLFKLDPMDFDYFTNIVRSEDEARLDTVLYEPARRPSRVSRPNPRDFVNEAVASVMDSSVSAYEFSLLVVQLLTSLASAEHNFPACPENCYPTCTQCIKFALENLCHLQFHSGSDNLSPSEAAELKVGWTQLLSLCLQKVMGCPDVTCSVILAGILPMMLRVLEDIICKLNTVQSVDDNERLEEVAYGLLCGSICFLHSLLQQGTDHDSLKTFLEMVRMTLESGGGRLLDRAILSLRFRSRRVLDHLAQLLVSLKHARWRLACPESRRGRSRKKKLMSSNNHHHQDTFGQIVSTPLLSTQHSCCVSNLFMVLVRILETADNSLPEVINSTLRVMSSCGTCCCMPAKTVISAVVKIIRDCPPKTRGLAFHLLEKTVYPQLGAYNVTPTRYDCTYCSGSNSPESASLFWQKLELFREQFISVKGRVGQSVICHLVRTSPLLRDSVKEVLLFRVFFPAFINCKTLYLRQKSDALEYVILAALSVFGSLLDDCSIHHFLVQKGVSHILDLIYLPEFSKHCCLVLEKTILCEWNMSSELNAVTSLGMLQTTADSATTAFLAATLKDGRRGRPMGVKRGKKSEPENVLQLLQGVSVFWRSYASLAFDNPALRSHFAQCSTLDDCGKLLDVVLGCITRPPGDQSNTTLGQDEASFYHICKLIESLLNFLLISSSQNSDLEEKTMEKLSNYLLCCNVRNVNLRKISEVLIKCSLGRSNADEALNTTKVPAMPAWSSRMDSSIEAEGGSCSESSVEEHYVTADEGYDADVELKRKISVPKDDYSIESDTSTSSGFEPFSEKVSPSIIYPRLCKLVIELAIKAYNDSTSGHDEESNEKKDLRSQSDLEWIILILQRLIVLCQDNAANCVSLHRHSVALRLLEGFSSCLGANDVRSSGIRRTVLELITVLAKTAISADELTSYLKIFKEPNPPLPDLLNALNALLCDITPQPNFLLSFPVAAPIESDSNVNQSTFKTQLLEGVTSCWGVAAINIPVSGHFGWSPWLNGCSVAMWLRTDCTVSPARSEAQRRVSVCPSLGALLSVDASRKMSTASRRVSRAESHVSACSTAISDLGLSFEEENAAPELQVILKNHMHIFSFGSENLMVECLGDVSSTDIIFRLTRVDSHKGYEVVAESVTKTTMQSGKWHHIAINVTDSVERKKTVVKVTWILDGHCEYVVRLPFAGLMLRKVRDMSLLIGHQTSDLAFRKVFSLSNLMLFRKASFTLERAMCHFGLGPNATTLAECKVDRYCLNISPAVTSESARSQVDWKCVFDDDIGALKELNESILCIYSAQDPNIACIYNNIGSSGGGSLLQLRATTVEPPAAQQVPVRVLPTIHAPLDCKRHETILPAISLIGGSSVFLYLFARVVELKGVGPEKGKALSLLLKLVQGDADLYSEFIGCEYYKLLGKVFATKSCETDQYLLKAIFDACCDKTILVEQDEDLNVDTVSDAVITNSFLLSALLGAWLSRADSSFALLRLTSALQALSRDNHPHREFNVQQLNRTQLINLLLTFCKERLFSEDKIRIGMKACHSIVEVVRSLMGAPPEFCHIVAVADCLVLLHPANATFITHLKNSFYLLLSAGQSYANHDLLVDPNALRTLRQMTAMSLDKWVYNSKERSDYTCPVDAGKLSKALTNMHLRASVLDDDQSTGILRKDEVDSNKYSDEVTLDSGISDTCKENHEDKNIVKAVDGSQQNLGSFFPSILSSWDMEGFNEKSESDESEKYIKDSDQSEEEDCLIAEGLLLILRDVLLVLPDNMSSQVLTHVVKYETLLVMANHYDHTVRTAVVQVISSYLRRASDETRNRFIKIRGYHHLANQISLYPSSLPLAEACLSLVNPCAVSLDDQHFISQMELTAHDLASLPPLLALLPRAVHDSLLTHHLVNVLRTIFCKGPQCVRTLLDHGLIEVLMKALLATAHIAVVPELISTHEVVVGDLQSFLNVIATNILTSPGVPNIQVVSDICLELRYVSRLEAESCGVDSRCVSVIRETQCRLLERCLDLLLDRVLSMQTDQKTAATFASLGLTPSEEPFGTRSLASSHSSVSVGNLQSSTGQKELSKSELRDRFNIIIPNCIQYLVNDELVLAESLLQSQYEVDFLHRLFPLLLQMIAATLGKRMYGRRSGAAAIFWAIRDTLRTETAEMLVWLMSPRQTIQIRLFAITSLLNSSHTKEVITSFLHTHPQIEQKFTVFLWDLMYNRKLSGADIRSCLELKENLQQWGVLSPHAIGNSSDVWDAECRMLTQQMDRQKVAWVKQLETVIIRCITKYDGLIKAMADDAMTMTRVVVDAQNGERKAVMAAVRRSVSACVAATAKWRELVDQVTHERALWCNEKAIPKFWRLDPTEGPHRVRVRLARTHLNLAPRFLKDDHQFKLEANTERQPLSFLFNSHEETCRSALVIERLHCNEKISVMAPACVVTPANEVPGELLLGESSLYFVADDRHLCSTLDAGSTAWPFEDVREIHHRRFQLKERAIELFLRTGRTYLIAFESCKEKDVFSAALSECDLPNLITADSLSLYTQQWRERSISNWEYLTQLNKIAGRSFNDLMQYPVLPFILADYSSQILDCTNPSTFRNLKKPMAVQEKQNEQHYVDNYNELLSGLKQVSLNREPYHYGSHYSNSGTVLHFLVRVPPFTNMLLQYQDRNFDLPDRTFHSVSTTWKLSSRDSTTDVKEMLPEFFYFPEFLTNFQGFNFGVRQNGQRVDDVELPPWCKDARMFILIHRQALESDYVTENLPHWVDLVFGFKQTGKAAVDAINVFHPATYCGFDVETIQDPLERIAWETMVRTYGQTPRQLLKTPHPLVVQSLVVSPVNARPVLQEVIGLKWGSYVGSPAESEPRIVWRQASRDRGITASFLPLSTNDVFAVPPSTTCLVRYSKEKGFSLVNSTTIRAALVTWGHPDGILRVKVRKEQMFEPLFRVSHLNPVTTCISEPESGLLWIGHVSGSISVVQFSFRSDKHQINFSPRPVRLHAHRSAVTSISLSRAFSIAVSTSRDRTVIIWDLNSVSYIRSMNFDDPVVLSTISSRMGDIATVTQTCEPSVSILHIHSINAAPIGRVVVNDGPITAVCFSSAVEGISVNVVACGLSNGIIRLWSTWDLTPVRDIHSAAQLPIISLAYSYDAQHLYAGCADGSVVVWENSNVKYDSNPPKFLNLKTLL